MNKWYDYCLLGTCFISLIIFIYYSSQFYREAFELSSPNESFCKKYTGIKLNDKCKTLTFKNCNEMNCCVYEKGGVCVAGDNGGPLFNTDKNGKTKNTPFYFQEKYYGC
jgi:hypothetical protein